MSKPKWVAASKKVREEWDSKEGTAVVPTSLLWVCGACGKRSRTRYGFDKDNRRVCDWGWDESCMLNAVLCDQDPKTAPLLLDKHGKLTPPSN